MPGPGGGTAPPVESEGCVVFPPSPQERKINSREMRHKCNRKFMKPLFFFILAIPFFF
jgi:hypothetical protein